MIEKVYQVMFSCWATTISWCSRKQSLVTLSTAEAKFVALNIYAF